MSSRPDSDAGRVFIGYARVSTDDQNLDLQRDALRQAGCSTIYEEAASGKSAARPELEQCRKALRAGDTLVVWRLDRLGRSLPDLVQIVADLEQRGVQFYAMRLVEGGSLADQIGDYLPEPRRAVELLGIALQKYPGAKQA